METAYSVILSSLTIINFQVGAASSAFPMAVLLIILTANVSPVKMDINLLIINA
jgi:hypothetical protein